MVVQTRQQKRKRDEEEAAEGARGPAEKRARTEECRVCQQGVPKTGLVRECHSVYHRECWAEMLLRTSSAPDCPRVCPVCSTPLPSVEEALADLDTTDLVGVLRNKLHPALKKAQESTTAMRELYQLSMQECILYAIQRPCAVLISAENDAMPLRASVEILEAVIRRVGEHTGMGLQHGWHAGRITVTI